MSEPNATSESLAPPLVLLFPLAVVVAAGVLSLGALQQFYLPLSAAEFVGVIAAVTACTLLLFGPSRIILTVVFLLALLDHQFRSPFIVPFAGVEWHPRELLLLLLFAHAAVKLAQRRLWIHWTPLHVAMLLYTAVFAYAAWRGLWLGNDASAIIAECRAPLFLGAFWVFAGTIHTPRDVHYYGYLALFVLSLMALATTGAFGYFALLGPIENTQNALGEFVPRLLAGYPVQSIRPSGHAWFEIGLVLSLGMLACPREPWFRKVLYTGLSVLFLAAIGAGMMRTAVVSVLVSLAVLAWLNLPRVVKGLSFWVTFLVVVGAGFSVLAPSDSSPATILGRDASLNARAVETAGALDAIRAHPLFGAGFGASFTALGLAHERSGEHSIPEAYHSLHNVWLYILWKAGLVGIGLTALALLGMLLYSRHIVNRLPTMSQRCLGRALQAALVGQLLASATMPRLGYANGAMLLGIWVMAFVLLERGAEGERGVPA